MNVQRERLKKYQRVVSLWLSKYDTAEIADETDLPECLVAAWVMTVRAAA